MPPACPNNDQDTPSSQSTSPVGLQNSGTCCCWIPLKQYDLAQYLEVSFWLHPSCRCSYPRLTGAGSLTVGSRADWAGAPVFTNFLWKKRKLGSGRWTVLGGVPNNCNMASGLSGITPRSSWCSHRRSSRNSSSAWPWCYPGVPSMERKHHLPPNRESWRAAKPKIPGSRILLWDVMNG